MKPETRAAQALGHIDPNTRALVPSIHVSTTFERDADGTYPAGYQYTRADNPAFELPERLLADLERGDLAMLFSSGLSAATSVFCALVPGDHVVAPKIMYWALRKWLSEFAVTWGISITYVDTSNNNEVINAIRPGDTRILWIETPANPTWQITDIAAMAAIAHEADIRLVVDSTVATPVHTRPIEHGADIVVHSATKFLNGHSDVLAGAVVAAVDDPFVQRIRAWRRGNGSVPGGFDAWLLLRGMRTLFPRVRQSSATALGIARHFHGDDRVRQVLYPGLPSHDGHNIAARQMTDGFSGMLSVRVRGGEAAAMATASRMKLFVRATSLGGTESLVEHRASMEGPSTPVAADLLRFSIGLEDVDDLIDDLDQALNHGVTGPDSSDPATDEFNTVRRSIVARGGDIVTVAGVTVGVGSPGAIEPLCDDLDLPRPTATTVSDLLADSINPMVAAHGGEIVLESEVDGVVRIRLGGRCQGCAMAQVTVRQGVEVLMRRHMNGIRQVIDVTDHSAGSDPYYPTSKR